MTLKIFFLKAQRDGWATGHFNASELDQMRAIVEACHEVGAPAIIGFSEGERKHMGLREAVALRDIMREEYNIPIFLNADHTKSVEAAKVAIDAGFDSVHIDLSALSFEENVAGTKEVVEYARVKHSNILKNVGMSLSVEGELGYLRGESKIQKEKIELKKEDYTNPEEAKKFVELTRVDRLAIAVGNIHGISLEEPDLDVERIKQIRKSVPGNVALVLHAGSGIPEEQIINAIQAGIANIHINTDIRVAYVEGMEQGLAKREEEAAMYKLDRAAIEKMKLVVKNKLKLFSSVDRL